MPRNATNRPYQYRSERQIAAKAILRHLCFVGKYVDEICIEAVSLDLHFLITIETHIRL